MYQIEVSDEEILECTSAKAALRMNLDRGTNSLKAVAIDLGITESILSRALNPQYDVTLRHDLVIPFMVSCGNAIYLRWQYLRLKELLPELDRQFRPADIDILTSEIAELKLVLKQSVEEIKKARPVKACGECGNAMFALAPQKCFVPKWLLETALMIEWETGGVL